MVPVISSETSFLWEATLQPFAAELPSDCDWIEFVGAPPMTAELDGLAHDWNQKDKANGVLSSQLPIDFVRDRVIEDTNKDLALVLGAGAASRLTGCTARYWRLESATTKVGGSRGSRFPCSFR